MENDTLSNRGSEIDFASLGEKMIREALIESERKPLEMEISKLLAMSEGANADVLRNLATLFINRIAVVASALRALEQELAAARRSRETRMRIDPIPFIPADRFEHRPPPPRTFEMSVADATFIGSNWHRLEHDQTNFWRWSGPMLVSSVLLPNLNGGEMRITIGFKLPFRQPYSSDSFQVFLDAQAVPLQKREAGGVCEGIVHVPADDVTGKMTLIIVSKPHHDLRQDGKRDSRVLGIGLMWLKLERIHPERCEVPNQPASAGDAAT